MHIKKKKGDIGVACVIAKLTELDWNVEIPITEHAPYDLFAEKNGELHTIQVRYCSPKSDNHVEVKLSNSWADRHGCHVRTRVAGEFTVLAVYVPKHGIYFIKDAELGENKRTFL
jgi:hypothetical protein